MRRPHLQVVRVGGLALGFVHRRRVDLPSPFADFVARGPCSCRVEVFDEPGLVTDPADRLCESGSWALYKQGQGLRFEAYAPPVYGLVPLLQADLSTDWSRGILRANPALCPPATRAAPINSPFGEFLLLSLLNQHGGLYVHAASILRDSAAVLFLGRSGVGKSTLSTLAARQGDTVLSDDRTVLRIERGRCVAYGTPFHGTARHWAAKCAPVRALCFLEQAADSRAERLGVAETATRLAAVSFGPFWSRTGMDEVLCQCELVARAVPAFAFRFRPDLSALEALDGATRQSGSQRAVRADAAAARGACTRRAPAAGRAGRLDAPRPRRR